MRGKYFNCHRNVYWSQHQLDCVCVCVCVFVCVCVWICCVLCVDLLCVLCVLCVDLLCCVVLCCVVLCCVVCGSAVCVVLCVVLCCDGVKSDVLVSLCVPLIGVLLLEYTSSRWGSGGKYRAAFHGTLQQPRVLIRHRKQTLGGKLCVWRGKRCVLCHTLRCGSFRVWMRVNDRSWVTLTLMSLCVRESERELSLFQNLAVLDLF